MIVRGACLCRSIEFEVNLPFLRFVKCHCSRCRKATGSAFAANAYVLPQAVRWKSGENDVVRTFQRQEASQRRSVDVAVHRFRTPLAAAERSSSLRARFWMTLVHHQQSIHAGARALAGFRMPSTCRASISPD